VEIESDKGHDAFLLDEPDFMGTTRGFLEAAARKSGIIASNTASTSVIEGPQS